MFEKSHLVNRLDLLGPLDGRYGNITADLGLIFGERGLQSRRILVEVKYLICLIRALGEKICPTGLGKTEEDILLTYPELSLEDAAVIKAIEKGGHPDYNGGRQTNHDVTAMTLWIKKKLLKGWADWMIPFVHLPLTSEDVNNIAYALQIRDAVEYHLLPKLQEVEGIISRMGHALAGMPMLARTHGQPATPTTLGKELNVFAKRLRDQIDTFTNVTNPMKIRVKFNGASGTYGAHTVTFPEIDWIGFSENFISSFNTEGARGYFIKFASNSVTTQIEPHDTYSEFLIC